MTVVEIELPPDDTVLWCHHCETFQRFRDLRRQQDAYLCTNPECDQRWPFGVWDMRDQPDYKTSPCWEIHARRNDVLYPGSCSCET